MRDSHYAELAPQKRATVGLPSRLSCRVSRQTSTRHASVTCRTLPIPILAKAASIRPLGPTSIRSIARGLERTAVVGKWAARTSRSQRKPLVGPRLPNTVPWLPSYTQQAMDIHSTFLRLSTERCRSIRALQVNSARMNRGGRRSISTRAEAALLATHWTRCKTRLRLLRTS